MLKPIVKNLVFVPVLILTFCSPYDARDGLRVTVQANLFGHSSTPAWVELDHPGAAAGPVCVTWDGGAVPGQLEPVGGGRVRVWWTVDLPPNESRTYGLEFGRSCSAEGYTWRPAGERATDLLFGDRPVLQYVHPTFDPEDIEGTKKPFHHVYDAPGSRPITKGPGGRYPHHRGIFFGYNHIFIGDSEEHLDTWHAGNGEHQQSEEVLVTHEGPVFGGHAVKIHWRDRQGEPFVEEIREVRVFGQPDGQTSIDFKSTLKTLRGRVRLGGDRQHAGVQFRAAQEVADNSERTRFLRPAAWAHLPSDQEVNTPEHVGLPWNAMQFPLEGRAYTVAYLSHPSNTEGAEMSERLYGRFGEFFPHELDEDRPLRVHYRFWVVADREVTREEIEQRYQELLSPPSVTP